MWCVNHNHLASHIAHSLLILLANQNVKIDVLYDNIILFLKKPRCLLIKFSNFHFGFYIKYSHIKTYIFYKLFPVFLYVLILSLLRRGEAWEAMVNCPLTHVKLKDTWHSSYIVILPLSGYLRYQVNVCNTSSYYAKVKNFNYSLNSKFFSITLFTCMNVILCNLYQIKQISNAKIKLKEKLSYLQWRK